MLSPGYFLVDVDFAGVVAAMAVVVVVDVSSLVAAFFSPVCKSCAHEEEVFR
jgi:hypothetical protein